ncbi:hypothetical protein [Paenibacillus sp.]|uniref:hypothetical protein n=1 Tax=Paenibacillus sp. TaxID=58172 RepID=UPI00281F1C22|nr:hypothetical protein [Paenibacillus sp.]MDR0270335.1 hypothetical protein [Paenibacillus sp.]
MTGIKNYDALTAKLNFLGSWTFEEIVGIDYDVDIDFEGNYTTVLTLSFFVSVIKTGRRFNMKIRYDNNLFYKIFIGLCIGSSIN